jgi:hypothetical protein
MTVVGTELWTPFYVLIQEDQADKSHNTHNKSALSIALTNPHSPPTMGHHTTQVNINSLLVFVYLSVQQAITLR